VLTGNRRGYVILVNHGAASQSITVQTTLPVRSISRIEPDGARSLTLDKSSWKMQIEPYDGAIAEWKE
jgi:hypothetical protein